MNLNASELLQRGRAAYRAGKLDAAEELFRRAVSAQPDSVIGHTLLANIALRRGDIRTAEQHALSAVGANPMEPAAYDALIAVQLKTRDIDALQAEYRQAATVRPGDFGTIYALGALLHKHGIPAEATDWLGRANELAPGSFPVEFQLAGALFEIGKYRKTLAIIGKMLRRGVDAPQLHNLAGCALLRMGRAVESVTAFRRALALNPREQAHHVGLSAALYHANRPDKAKEVTENFLKIFPALTYKTEYPEANVLILSGVGLEDCFTEPTAIKKQIYVAGNTVSQLEAGRNTYHFMHIQHPDLLAAIRALGPIDVVYNNIANAESSIKRGRRSAIRELVEKLGVPVINAPEAIEQTTRANNARVIPDKTGITFPKTLSFGLRDGDARDVTEKIIQSVCFPMLIRRTRTNKDTDVALVADEAALAEALDYYRKQGIEEIYAIEFMTEEFRPGIYRKIRCAIIDKAVYPVRVDFSANWNVRRQREDSALMKANQDLMDSEHAFLRDPVDYIGPDNFAKLEALGRLYDLDFLGVDFNIVGDGEMILFEANPAMNCIENRAVEMFPYFANYWERILTAFEDMIVKKAGKR